MINIFYNLKQLFFNIILEIATQNNISIKDEDFNNFNIEPSKEKSHGDLATNIAMVFSKNFTTIKDLSSPQKLALAIIKEACRDNSSLEIKKLEIAGPGFINIFLHNQAIYQIIAEIVISKTYLLPNIGKKEKINLEYASPNPTGPIHVGHCRGAIYGDVLANLLSKVGYDVLKEYYVNDAGSQIDNLIKSAYFRYLQALNNEIQENSNMPEGLYPGAYLIPIGIKIKEIYQAQLKDKSPIDYIPLLRDLVVDEMLKMIITDLKELGIKHDSYFSEKKQLHDNNKIEQAILILKNKGLIYEGKLALPKGKKGNNIPINELSEDYEEKDQLLFRSTLFGDDSDRVVKKSDGTPTYLAGDIAYALSKFERGAKKMILPLGFDHVGYVKRLNAVVQAVTDGQAQVKVILCQMVKFVKGGEALKMSKRAGNFITAKEVIEEVGADAMRFIMLTRKNDAHFDFDLAKVVETSKDNPIFYVQYAHTRCCSVLRNLAKEITCLKNFASELEDKNKDLKACQQILDELSNLNDEAEIELAKKIVAYPRAIEMAVANFEPHRLAFYLQEISALFHSLWNKGIDHPELRFIIPQNLAITKARIYLIIATKKIIASALDIFNIKPLEEMK
jgi:arginyl-tRNA synthetase